MPPFLCFMLLLILALPVHAAILVDGEAVLFNNTAWHLLMPSAKVTFYGPYYQAGMLTASGELYNPDGDGCAVGPTLLNRLRTEYAGASGVYGILPCLRSAEGWECEPLLWGWELRLTDAEGRVVTCRVNDSGLDGLDVDLGDGAWERAWGDRAQGVRMVKVEVLH